MGHKKIIKSMSESKVKNYIIPGLDSVMLTNGKVRMFESSRHDAGTVIPHTHRFDFACYVLEGEVNNRIYNPVSPFGDGTGSKLEGDIFTVRTIARDTNEAFGEYERITEDSRANFLSSYDTYVEGDWYTMTADEYHSICFGKDAKVLFFEGPEVRNTSKILLPYVNGETLEIMECDKPWMYLEDD